MSKIYGIPVTTPINPSKFSGVSDEVVTQVVKDYLEENPVTSGATAEQAAQITQNKSDIAKLNNEKLSTGALNTAIDTALAQAKAGGEFDGAPGEPGSDGQDGADGYTPERGVDYFTEEDVAEIVSRITSTMPMIYTTDTVPTGWKHGDIWLPPAEE